MNQWRSDCFTRSSSNGTLRPVEPAERHGRTHQPRLPGDPEPEIVLLHEPVRRIVAARGAEYVAPHAGDVADPGPFGEVVLVGQQGLPRLVAGADQDRVVAVHDPGRRLRRKPREHLVHETGQRIHERGQEEQDLAARGLDRRVERRGAVLRLPHRHDLEPGAEALDTASACARDLPKSNSERMTLITGGSGPRGDGNTVGGRAEPAEVLGQPLDREGPDFEKHRWRRAARVPAHAAPARPARDRATRPGASVARAPRASGDSVPLAK